MAFQQRPIVPAGPLYEMAKLAKVDNDPAILHWIQGATLSSSPNSIRALAKYLNFKASEQLVRQIPLYRPRQDELRHDGTTRRLIGFGFVEGNRRTPFILPIDVLNQHVAVLGSTGVGKTLLLRMTAAQAMSHSNVWIFDREKSDYRDFAAAVPGLLVLDCRSDLAWNPLQVHGPITPQQAITTFVSVLSKSMDLLTAAQSLLQQSAHESFEARGIFAGSENYPTLYDLRACIAAKKPRGYRASQYQDTVLNRLDGMLWEAPQLYSYQKGFPIEELARRNVVFELKGLNEHHGRFLAMHLLSTLFQHRLRSGERGNWLRTLVIIDEAAWLAPPVRNVEAIGWSPLADVLRMGRETGIGLCLASQTSNLDDAVLENARTRFVFRLGHGKDIERVKSALSLSQEQAEFISRLGTGECIVGIAQVRPFLLKVPEVTL